MTDVFGETISVPSRLGVTADFTSGQLQLHFHPYSEVLHHGVVRASVLSFMIDVVAGIVLDDEPDVWTLTSDMTVRMRPLPAPASIHTQSKILRRGRRSATCLVDLVDADGVPVGTGAIGFVKVPRRASDPPKPKVSFERISTLFNGTHRLTNPLRDEAGIAVLNPQDGVVEVPVTNELRNPAGTLQGAMVALVAEAAAEELVSSRFDIPAVVTELDLRYLAQTGSGPVRTKATLLGDSPDAPIQVELFDLSTDRLTTLVYARAATISA
jgi:acyl-coenzyme A thioesterase PaaI-like protein